MNLLSYTGKIIIAMYQNPNVPISRIAIYVNNTLNPRVYILQKALIKAKLIKVRKSGKTKITTFSKDFIQYYEALYKIKKLEDKLKNEL